MKLDDLRAQIDAIDKDILTLLSKRMDIVHKVGSLKRENGAKGVFIRPKRETDMMKRILEMGAGKFPKPALFTIWRAIISASLQVENPFRVVTTQDIGKEVFEYFGTFTEYVVLPDEGQVFKHMTAADVGVLPKGVNLARMPANMKIFAEIGKFNAFANIEED
jgi:chorismate mutase/prephenate dehydratase